MGNLFLKETKFGISTCAGRNFSIGERIIKFVGDFFDKNDLPPILEPQDDRYTQISDNLYIGPSGGFDDYVDHSCDPNSGLMLLSDGFWLVAIREILENEKITWDYSTFMNDDFEIQCECGSPKCRKVVGDFKFLDKDLQHHYIKLKIVPQFIIKKMEL